MYNSLQSTTLISNFEKVPGDFLQVGPVHQGFELMRMNLHSFTQSILKKSISQCRVGEEFTRSRFDFLSHELLDHFLLPIQAIIYICDSGSNLMGEFVDDTFEMGDLLLEPLDVRRSSESVFLCLLF